MKLVSIMMTLKDIFVRPHIEITRDGSQPRKNERGRHAPCSLLDMPGHSKTTHIPTFVS